MGTRLRLVGAWAVAGACAWECLALASDGALPTWSAMAQRVRRHPVGMDGWDDAKVLS